MQKTKLIWSLHGPENQLHAMFDSLDAFAEWCGARSDEYLHCELRPLGEGDGGEHRNGWRHKTLEVHAIGGERLGLLSAGAIYATLT